MIEEEKDPAYNIDLASIDTFISSPLWKLMDSEIEDLIETLKETVVSSVLTATKEDLAFFAGEIQALRIIKNWPDNLRSDVEQEIESSSLEKQVLSLNK